MLAHPRTAKDVDALVASMSALGLNALLLDVFSSGVNHVKTSAASGTDIIAEALVRTAGTGIGVYADLSLLPWGNAPPESLQDLTIDGLNSRDAALQEYKDGPKTNYDYATGKPVPFAAPPVLVSPSAPAVSASLTAQVMDLAARPGLAGLVWEDAYPIPGFGYTPAMRQAFLRSAHADPWDITPDNRTKRATRLPLFDDDAIDKDLSSRWDSAVTSDHKNLLGALRAAMSRPDGSPLPVLMEQDAPNISLLSSWDDPKQDAPPLREINPDRGYFSEDKVAQIARTQGRLVLRCDAVENDGDIPALARQLEANTKKPIGDGFVLEFEHDEVTQGAAPLASLIQAVGAENYAKPAQKAVH